MKVENRAYASPIYALFVSQGSRATFNSIPVGVSTTAVMMLRGAPFVVYSGAANSDSVTNAQLSVLRHSFLRLGECTPYPAEVSPPYAELIFGFAKLWHPMVSVAPSVSLRQLPTQETVTLISSQNSTGFQYKADHSVQENH